MKFLFWFFFITTIIYIVLLLFYSPKQKWKTYLWFPSIPMLLLTAGTGYLFCLQYDSHRNTKAVEDYFISNCKGFDMMPMEDPIIVKACGNTYHVKADKGKIILIEIVSDTSKTRD